MQETAEGSFDFGKMRQNVFLSSLPADKQDGVQAAADWRAVLIRLKGNVCRKVMILDVIYTSQVSLHIIFRLMNVGLINNLRNLNST
jgi:hypothetical protein